MTTIAELLSALDDLRQYASEVVEESYRLTIVGEQLDSRVRIELLRVFSIVSHLVGERPSLLASDGMVDEHDLSGVDYDNEPWRLIVSKKMLAQSIRARDEENTLLFFSVEGFHQWLRWFDPFLFPTSDLEPDLTQPTTIRVHGLTEGFGGPMLWVLPPGASAPQPEPMKLPDATKVRNIIHISANKALRVHPAAFSLSWGKLDSSAATPMLRMSASVLAASIVHELKLADDGYSVILRGAKRIELKLVNEDEAISEETLRKLIETVQWAYAEREETRLSLLMDRLSIDIEQGVSLLSGVEKFLDPALQQARDSYAFVILERKDAYHKEIRDLMKDMKSQADLYASKVRDLISGLTRDILGILAFISLTFIARFDHNNLESLLRSSELGLLTKALAGYLALSCVLQFSAHARDAKLAYDESRGWLDVLQHYASQRDKAERFLEPIEKRRDALFSVMYIIGFIYVMLIATTWHLPALVLSLIGA
ncbi:hypothetical protein [Ectothiorhodospira shaposhnikovii]|uniref:hypothetical protein n=1 Tax=Ectothiorhodospira shaposhnikovii TaxID=1054 RepID=UPI001EE89B27|nr:hypothetical protein [Ectothiorhodospira shaposhnikovii]MCG5512340.1 hypothetical protein [Ectothiorhodospira shaposhnikovii]